MKFIPFKLINVADAANGVNLNVKINNPLNSNINTIPQFIQAILNIVITVGVPVVTLAIIWTGFKFVMAQGNKDELEVAKKALMYTLIGAALLLGSWIIAQAIGSTVAQITS